MCQASAQCAVHSQLLSECKCSAVGQYLTSRPHRLAYDVLGEVAGDRLGEATLAPSTEHIQGLSLCRLSGDLAGDLVTSRHHGCISGKGTRLTWQAAFRNLATTAAWQTSSSQVPELACWILRLTISLVCWGLPFDPGPTWPALPEVEACCCGGSAALAARTCRSIIINAHAHGQQRPLCAGIRGINTPLFR